MRFNLEHLNAGQYASVFLSYVHTVNGKWLESGRVRDGSEGCRWGVAHFVG